MNRVSLTNNNSVITFEERAGVQFQIQEEIGRGASCIVYYAVGADKTEHLLKEYYPKDLGLNRDSSGRIVVPADKTEAFKRGLARFRDGHTKQREFR